MDIKGKFDALVAENHMEDKVTINTVGCFGFCSQGPFVKILPEDTLYRLVKVEDVEEIFNTDILGGEIVERLLYIEPNTGEKVVKQDDINFYKKQKRVALHGGGVINPEDINEAMGYGAFQGLKRALSMDHKAVIDEVLASGLRGRGGGGMPYCKLHIEDHAIQGISLTKRCINFFPFTGKYLDDIALEIRFPEWYDTAVQTDLKRPPLYETTPSDQIIISEKKVLI